MLAFVLLFLGTYYFAMGFHNVDLIVNYQNIAIELNPHLEECDITTLEGINEALDQGVDRQARPLIDYYIVAMRQLYAGLVLMFLSGLLLANGLVSIKK